MGCFRAYRTRKLRVIIIAITLSVLFFATIIFYFSNHGQKEVYIEYAFVVQILILAYFFYNLWKFEKDVNFEFAGFEKNRERYRDVIPARVERPKWPEMRGEVEKLLQELNILTKFLEENENEIENK